MKYTLYDKVNNTCQNMYQPLPILALGHPTLWSIFVTRVDTAYDTDFVMYHSLYNKDETMLHHEIIIMVSFRHFRSCINESVF